MTKTIDFNNLSSGTVVDNEYQSDGVTIQAWTAGGTGDRAMIFDTANPTGGDYDLATSNLGNALIVSEDGDSSDPDDAIGGTFRFCFADGADVQSLTFLDNEEGATVRFYNEHGQLIATRQIPTTGDNGQHIATFDVDGVYTMDVQLHGSGAVDNLVFDDIVNLDGTVEGTSGDDLIDVNYTGDPDGDRVDNNDAILPGDTGNDDLIVAGAGNDSVLAGDGNDFVFGGTGDDRIDGGAGDDTLCGQDGDDVLFGGNGNDILEGMNDNDVLFGGAGADSLYGDAGDDMLFGGSGDDLIKGGTGDDKVEASWGDDTIFGGAGNDDLWASGDDDLVYGGDGADSVFGGHGQDTVYGDAGNDTLSGGSDDDTVYGGAGDDVIEGDTLYKDDTGAAGDDLLLGGDGDDSINGGGGNDTIYGDNGGDAGGDAPRESFDWQGLSDAEIDSTATKDTGTVSVTYTRTEDTGNHFSEVGTETQNVDGIDAGDGTVDTNTALKSETSGQGNTGAFQWEFSDAVDNVSFNINDIDGDGVVKVTAFDADGNPIEVILTGGADLTLLDTDTVAGADTADSNGGYDPATSDDYSLTVSIPGPVSKIVIEHTQDGTDNSGIYVTEIFYDSVGVVGAEGGNDVIDGGAGDDVIFGEGGDDTITGGGGADIIDGGAGADTIIGGAGDTVDGGADGDDNDVLDLTGEGPFILTGPDGTGDPILDSNGNGLDGRVVFVDADGNPTGDIIDFTEIEQIIGDEVTNFDPDAVDDAVDAVEDGVSDLGNVIAANDTDPDGDTLTVGAVNGDDTLVGAPVAGDNGGLVTINADGTASFDANGDFEALGEGETATTEVTYTVDDGNGGTDTATVTVTVTGTNDAPTAVADTGTTDQDTVLDLGNIVAANDTDPEGDTLTVGAVNGDDTLVGTPVAGDNGGLVTINADGTASFDPNGDFDALGIGENATTEVTYTITDPDGAESTTTVTVTVTGSNDGPTAVADAFVTDEDTAGDLGNVLTNDEDPDGDTLTVGAVNGDETLVGTPVAGDNGGLVTINPDGSISFDPNGDFEALAPGETAETTVTYTATDPSGQTSTETVTITVNGVNDGPDATDNAYVVSLSETAGDVDGNVITDDTGADVDSDPEGDDLTVVAVGGDPANVGNAVAGDNGGTFTINDDGTVDFDAGDDFDDLGLGATRDTTVSYTIVDENGATDTADVTFTVTGINDGTVQGTDGNDVINPDIPYVDADGDIVDAGDGILPGDEGTDNDVIYGFGGDDSIAAGNGDDVVFGGADNDIVKGNLGNDVLFGGAGDDNVQGGLGNDVIDGGAGDDLLLGGDGDDTVAGGAGDDRIFGAEGDDELRGGSGNDTVEGSEGNDTLFGGTGDDDLWGGLDDDTVIGGAGNDTVAGEDGDDELHGGFGDDIFFGGAGNDVISDVEGSDSVDAGDGDDVINVGSSQGDEAPDVGYPEQPSATIPGLVFPGYDADEDPDDDKDFVDGGAGNDIINTGDDDDSIIGGSGNDTINAGFDDDTVDGGTGDDFIEGGEGNDVIEGGDGDDTIYGGLESPFADAVSFPDDEPDAAGFQDLVPENNGDTIFGGAGNDTIFGQDDDDTLFGGAGDDVLDGGVDDDLLVGGDGDDVLIGGQGNDSLDGGAGEDTIFGGAGDDVVTGGEDGDVIFGGDGNDSLEGRSGNDEIFGDDGDDKIVGNGGNDSLFGGAGDDEITGNIEDDLIDGGDGNDDLRAQAGDDVIDGGDGDDVIDGGLDDDTIDGGDGNDTIIGGEGVDDLSGGFGNDTFLGGNGGDVVTGGEDADGNDIDVLDLTGSNVDRIDYVDGDPEAGTVTFLDGSTMTFSEIENVIPCFTPGTLIATPKGERLVEELQVGDRIITRDNGIQEIAWVGHKPMAGTQLVQNPHLQPVLIKRGALGHGLPERDMMVSPNHRVLVSSDKTQLYFEESEVLAAAKHMVGAEGIHTVNVMQTTYVHFMFERHEVVLSNGAWTESFQPGDYSLKGIGNSQRNEIFDLFPELSTKTGLENYQSARKALKKHEAKLLLK
jgi:Ca2+-binding RTX toxin-like protein